MIAIIVGMLVAGRQADPLRADVVRRLMEERDRIRKQRVQPDAVNSPEVSKVLEERTKEVEDSIAGLDPSCVFGRRLLEEAREIYEQCIG